MPLGYAVVASPGAGVWAIGDAWFPRGRSRFLTLVEMQLVSGASLLLFLAVQEWMERRGSVWLLPVFLLGGAVAAWLSLARRPQERSIAQRGYVGSHYLWTPVSQNLSPLHSARDALLM
jgi:hypothetical protein